MRNLHATLSAQFKGKHIFREGAFTGIAVVKNGQKVEDKGTASMVSRAVRSPAMV